jgi:hypothetical protein
MISVFLQLDDFRESKIRRFHSTSLFDVLSLGALPLLLSLHVTTFPLIKYFYSTFLTALNQANRKTL